MIWYMCESGDSFFIGDRIASRSFSFAHNSGVRRG